MMMKGGSSSGSCVKSTVGSLKKNEKKARTCVTAITRESIPEINGAPAPAVFTKHNKIKKSKEHAMS